MATIYRYIVELREGGADGRTNNTTSKKGAGKKGKDTLNTFGSSRGGVEHGRRMRAINPLLNRATGGYWEKGMRIGRASIGMAKNVQEKGIKGVMAGPAWAIIVAFIIQTFFKLQNKNLEWGQQRNIQNYKQMETGIGQVHGEYSVSRNFWSGRVTYNENK